MLHQDARHATGYLLVRQPKQLSQASATRTFTKLGVKEDTAVGSQGWKKVKIGNGQEPGAMLKQLQAEGECMFDRFLDCCLRGCG